MNLANKLTMFRVFLIPVFLVALYSGDNFYLYPYPNHIAAAVFILASATDWLDGYIARSRNLVSNFGKFADPLADKLLVAAALIAFVDFGVLSAWVVILLISREFVVTGLRLLAAEKGIVLAADIWGKLKTAAQMVMIVFLLLDFSFSGVYVIETILITASVLLSLWSACGYIVKNRHVFK